MRIELLHEYTVFCRWLNFSKAAEELHITQSCLSKHMADLEQETGLRLIDRGKSAVGITPVGNAFLEEASSIASAYEAAIDRCYSMQRSKAAAIRVQELMQNELMGKLYGLAVGYERANSASFSFIPLMHEDSLDALGQGGLDVAIGLRFGSPEAFEREDWGEGIEARYFASEELYVWFQRENRKLAALETVTLDSLRSTPIMTTAGKRYDYIGSAVKQLYLDHGIVPRFRSSHIVDSPTAYFLSNFHDSVFFATASMANDPRIKARDDLLCRSLEQPLFTINAYLLAKRTNRDAMSFLEHVSKGRERSA